MHAFKIRRAVDKLRAVWWTFSCKLFFSTALMEEFLFSWKRSTKQKLSTSIWREAGIICQQCPFLSVQWKAAPSSSLPQVAHSYLTCLQGRSALYTHTHTHMWTDRYTTEGDVLSNPSGAKPDSTENASVRSSPISGMRAVKIRGST